MDKREVKRLKEIILDAVYLGICFGLVLMALSIISCANAPTVQGPADGAIYKNDIKGTINGAPFDGVGVVPYSQSYDMKIVSRVDVDLLTVKSCHRDFSVESAIQLGWFQSKRGYEYQYVPVQGIEDFGSCLVHIGAYNKADGQNAWGVIDFETPGETLQAENQCNGSSQQTNGVSICQSEVGLIQELIFQTPVRMSTKVDPKCLITPPPDGLRWQYHVPSGECVMAFGEINPPYRIHRHTSEGYTDILIRGEQ